eukprot:CAMPEP_0114458618 /NCGR_PEP_ID=MMETSP0104-20121206/4778_1 /TAXON_ID=37642 ORGANISM="Paraphysomonas imperforata, Strain PA2" /NCGR_SAMPLE_ID=MMETSP0104 /ASSEMBLY_ACC=CAM_ASM_000202 /LENGTH=355 /DNA_ID=CAMNT_0001631215 /DNA_START=364 /DNA_END=1431 /DNA_ORIENTATION=-
MTWKKCVKIFNVIPALDCGCHETAEWRHERSEKAVSDAMQLDWQQTHRLSTQPHDSGENIVPGKEYLMYIAMNRVDCRGDEGQFLSRAREPGIASQKYREKEGKHTSQDPRAEKPLPCLLRGERQEWGLNKLASHCDSAKVRRHIIHDNCSHGEKEPEESIQRTARKKLRLTHNHHHCDDGPHELADLEADEARLESEDSYHKQYAVQREYNCFYVLRDMSQMCHLPMARTEFMKAFAIYIDHGQGEPRPLNGAKQGHGLLLRLLVSHVDQFPKQLSLCEYANKDAIHIPSAEHRAVERDHAAPHSRAYQHFAKAGFVIGYFFWGWITTNLQLSCTRRIIPLLIASAVAPLPGAA